MTLMKRSNALFPEFLDDFFGRDWLNSTLDRTVTTPAVNIRETEDNFKVEMAAPGMEKKHFNVELENNLLTISYEKEQKHEEKNEDGEYAKREFNYQSFSRSFTLPNTVMADEIKAEYKDGVLMLTLPKKEEAKQKTTKQISIS